MLRSFIDKIRYFLGSRSGTSAVEFAIVSHVLILFVFGIIAFGLYFGAAHSVQELASDAARASVAGLDDTERASIVAGFMERNGGEYPLLDQRYLTYEAHPSASDPEEYQVSVHYNAEKLPIWSLSADIPLPGKIISRTSTIRVGGA